MMKGNNGRLILATDDCLGIDLRLGGKRRQFFLTKGMVKPDEKKSFSSIVSKDKSVVLSSQGWLEEDCFEFWINDTLIGFCDLEYPDFSAVSNQLLVDLRSIYLVPECRNIGLGGYLALELSREVSRQIVEEVWKKEGEFPSKNLRVVYSCDFENKDGEHFFNRFVHFAQNTIELDLKSRFPELCLEQSVHASY